MEAPKDCKKMASWNLIDRCSLKGWGGFSKGVGGSPLEERVDLLLALPFSYSPAALC